MTNFQMVAKKAITDFLSSRLGANMDVRCSEGFSDTHRSIVERIWITICGWAGRAKPGEQFILIEFKFKESLASIYIYSSEIGIEFGKDTWYAYDMVDFKTTDAVIDEALKKVSQKLEDSKC